MRLNAIIPCMGMVALSVCSVLAGNGGGAMPSALWNFQPQQAFSAIAFFEKNLGRGEAALAVGVTETHVNSPCANLPNGSITVTASGWTGSTMSFALTGTNYLGNPVSSTVTENPTDGIRTFSGLRAGTYQVVVTAANGSSTVSGIIVQHPPTATTPTTSTTAQSCLSGGTITINHNFNTPSGIYQSLASNVVASVTFSLTSGPSAPLTMVVTNPGGSPTLYSHTFLALLPGTYGGSVQVNGCAVSTITGIVVAPVTAIVPGTPSSTPVSCFGGANGTATFSATGGAGGFTYNIGGGPQGSGSFTGLTAGLYTCTITDVNSCTATSSVTVGTPTDITVNAPASTPVTCFGGSDGTATFSATGGTGSLTYSLGIGVGGGPNGTGSFSGLASGSYTCTITDANSCSKTSTISVGTPTAISPSSTQINVTCFGGSNGSVDLSVSGGTPGYTFLWSNSATTEDIGGLTAGNYSVVIKDANQCTATHSVNITEPTIVTVGGTTTDVSCNGGNNGTITLTVTGGAGGTLTYNWSGAGTVNGQANQSGLAAGSYSVTVTDGSGCTGANTFTIIDPTDLVLSAVVDSANCNGGADGSINITATGGTSPYTYDWADIPGSPDAEDRTGLVANSYTVIVTDANSCTETLTEEVKQPAALVFNSAAPTDPLCNNGSDGSILLTASGGVMNYNFTIDNGGGPVGPTNFANGSSTHTISGLSAGNYDITVSDHYGCTANTDFSVVLSEPTAISLTTSNVIDATCEGYSNGSFEFSLSGGTPNYQYSLERDDVLYTAMTPTVGGTILVGGLDSAKWTVNIVDDNGCTASIDQGITDLTPVSGTTVVTDVDCHGSSTGSIAVTGTGGAPGMVGYTYQISPDPNTVSPQGPASNYTFAGLPAGTYTITITDPIGCSGTLTKTVGEPAAALTATSTNTNPLCNLLNNGTNNGSIVLNVSGGTAPYTYYWEKDNVAYSTDKDLTNIGGGSYSVTITDDNGCSFVLGPIAITEPPLLIIDDVAVVEPNCYGDFNGSATVDAMGGTPNYAYTLVGPVPNSPLVQFNNPLFAGVTNGSYTAIVTDQNGCSASYDFDITLPEAIDLTAATTNVSCYGGSNGAIDLTATGGTAPLTFDWDNDGADAPDDDTEDLSGLLPGDYTVTVTDDHGCTATLGPITITQPEEWSASLTFTDSTSCFGGTDGSLTAAVAGTSLDPDFTYTLTGPTGATEGPTAATSHLFENLAAGNYTLVVTDDNGCTATATATVLTPLPILFLPLPVVTDATCPGGTDGSIYFGLCGGTTDEETGYQVMLCDDLGNPLVPPQSWEVTGGCSFGQAVTTFTDAATTQAAIVLSPDNTQRFPSRSYDPMAFTMRSFNPAGATNNVTWTLTVPAGYVEVRIRGVYLGLSPANEPLTYSVDGGAFTSLSDPSGGPLQIIRPTIPVNPLGGTVITLKMQSLALGMSTFAFTVAAFEEGFANLTINDLAPDDYIVKVTDKNGCTAQLPFTIGAPAPIDLSVVTVTDASCPGGNDGAIEMTPSGGTAPYTYLWSDGQTTNPAIGLAAGEYFVTVTDINGCTAETSIPIEVFDPEPLSALFTYDEPTCHGDDDGGIELTMSGGTSPYYFDWSWDLGPDVPDYPTPGDNSDTTNLAAGVYTVTVFDGNGCSATFAATLGQPDLLVATLDNATDLTCHDTDDGLIEATATGGTADYQFFLTGTVTGPPVAPFSAGPQNSTGSTSFSGLGGGTYSLLVVDDHGCTASVNTIVIVNPDALDANSSQPLVSCQGGELTVDPTGGTGPYTIQMVDCNDFSPIGLPITGVVDYHIFTGLGAGDFCFEINDANDCGPAYATATILPGDIQPDIFLNAYPTDVLCNGGSTGSILAVASGGSGDGFDFDLFDGNGDPVGSTITDLGTPFEANFTGLPVGSYTVVATDVTHGCSITYEVEIGEPGILYVEFTADPNPVLCFGDESTMEVGASGGTPPYTLTVNGNPQTLDVPFQLTAGSYDILVTDDNGCTNLYEDYLITEPAELIASAVPDAPILCFGGSTSVTVSATGGTPGYQGTGTVLEVTAGTHTYTVTDANGCTDEVTITITQPTPVVASESHPPIACHGGTTTVTISGSGGTPSYTGEGTFTLGAGTYTYTVTDANGCSDDIQFTITEPDALTASATVTTPIPCMGGTGEVTVSASGGTAPYTGTGPQTVSAGTHTFTVTDDNGCSTSVTITVEEPTMINIVLSAINGSGCTQNGTITATVTGGTPGLNGYTYLWSNNGGTTATINPPAGSYSVTVTDGNGCTKEAGPISVTQPVLLTATATSSPTDCNGAANGSIFVTASGGTAPYFYSKNGGAPMPTYQTSPAFGGLLAGTYLIVVKDAAGCTYTIPGGVTVSEPTPVTATFSVDPAACNGSPTGSITVTASGGTPGYFYSKNNGMTFQPSPLFAGLGIGNYQVVVRDANGCTFSAIVNVPVATGPTVSASSTPILCNGGSSTVTVTATGGHPTYSGTGTFTRSAGTHTFTVTDAYGCTGVATITITEPDVLVASSSYMPILCNGGSSTVTVTATGGTAPYTGTGSFNNTTGAYSYTVTDANGCSSTTTGNIPEPALLVASSSATPILCNGGTTTITISATGGTAPYSGVGTVSEVAGTYTYVVFDENGCSATTTITVTQPAPLQAGATYTPILCHGGSSTVTVTATGGTAPYSGTGDFPQTAGSHTYTVTDANGCSSHITVEITEPAAIEIIETIPPILCFGGTTTISFTVTGGTFASPLCPTPCTLVASAPTASLNVTDDNGCTATETYDIPEPSAIALSETHDDAICGLSNGSINLSVSGGTPQGVNCTDYTYLWSPGGQTTQDISGLAPGTYTVTVTDCNGCTKELTIVIGQTPSVTLSTTQVDVSCHGGSNGSIDLTVNSGNAPFAYLWNDGATTEDRTGLAAGTYTVVVTATGGCTATTSVTITQPDVLTASHTATDILCMGGLSTVVISATGGTPPYTGTGTYQLAANPYLYIISDSKGCTTSLSFTITQPTMLNLTEQHVNATCGSSNGSIDLSVSGGSPNCPSGYTYSWAPGGQTTQDISGLAPGVYTVTVTDCNGCTKVLSVTIGQTPSVTLSATSTATTCFGGSNGSIDLSVTSGNSPFTYLWSPGGQTTQDLNGIPAGTYTVTVTATGGCTATTSVTVGQPTAVVPTATAGTIFCHGGTTTVEVSATGGTAPYSGTGNFTAGAGFHSYTVTDANGCQATATISIAEPSAITVTETHGSILCMGGSAQVVISAQGGTGDLIGTGTFTQSAGTVTYTVTDENGCTGSVTVTLTEPSMINITEQHGTILCHGGSAQVGISATGGTSPYTGTGSFLQAAGAHVYIVTDANGCSKNITVTLTEPPLLTAMATGSTALCGAQLGCITVSATGGTPDYTYVVTNSAGGTVSTGAATQPGNSAQICQLPIGTYTVTYTDANGCTASASATITGQPAVTASMQMTNVSCNGGSNGAIDLTVSTGTAPYTFAWSPGGQTTEDLTGIAAGTYSVTITDANGCSLVKNMTITQPPQLLLSETHVNATCGSPNGSITLTASGGTAPYLYSLNGGTPQSSGSFGGLGGGSYSAVVTDAHGCTKTLTVTVVQTGSPVQIGTQVVNIPCFGGSTGSILATASGGSAPYLYSFNGGNFGPNNNFGQLSAGQYTVVAQDANGCSTTVQVTITQPTQLNATATGSPALCNGTATGSITVNASGGTPAYMYKLGNGSFQSNNVFSNLAAGTYVVVVKDANGCERSVQATVQQPAALTVTATPVNATCNGLADGKIGAVATGGTPGYEYKIGAGAYQPSGQFNGLAAGTYTITAKDANGCTATATAIVGQPPAGPLGIALNAVLPVSCPGGTNGAIYVTVSGCGPFTYSWYNITNLLVGSAEDLVNVPAGTYSLFVIDGGGMTTSLTGIVVGTVPQTIQNLVIENNTTCSVTIKWDATPNTDGYEVRFKPCSATVWSTFNAGTATSYTFSGLSALTCYDFCVRFKSEDCDGAWTCITGSNTPEFNPPINTSATVNSNTSATIKWAQSPCNTQAPANVELRYRKVGAPAWTVLTLAGSATSQTLNNLMAGMCYEYRLRNRYVVAGVSKWSNFTTTKVFCLPNFAPTGGGASLVTVDEGNILDIQIDVMDEPEFVETPVRQTATETLDFSLFPNPTTDFVNLRFRSVDAANSLTIRLLALSGQLVLQETFNSPAGIEDQRFDVSALPQGFYLIEVSNGAQRRVEKFVKQ